jgi:glucose-1-phosphate cytidylyltransferase
MKVIILAGGLGSRLGEITKTLPKPMIKIQGIPILSHIIKHYYKFGFTDFIIATGYKSQIIKNYYISSNYKNKNSDLILDLLKNNKIQLKSVNTGLKTMTGGRIKKLSKILKNEETFLMTYGDGVSNINLTKLLEFHKKNNKIVTVSAVHPTARFGEIIIKKNLVTSFKEKPQTKKDWINGGFFVCKREFLNYIKDDNAILEGYPLETLSKIKQLAAFKHDGFWQCVDTPRDKLILEKILNK